VTAGGLRPRRGEADVVQQDVSEADKRGIESAIAASVIGKGSQAPGAAGAFALFSSPEKGILHLLGSA